jgi:hypothetical protein
MIAIWAEANGIENIDPFGSDRNFVGASARHRFAVSFKSVGEFKKDKK